MRVLLISTYELGHQPLHVASPAAALSRAGHEARCLDLSVEPWDPDALDWAQAVGFSVPMHTAMRLAMNAARRVRSEHPRLAICFYGLYAPVSQELVVGELAGRAIAGEYEPALVAWANGLAGPGAPVAASEQRVIHLQRGNFDLPARDRRLRCRYPKLTGGSHEGWRPVGRRGQDQEQALHLAIVDAWTTSPCW